jgi:hypothetical protein
MTTQNTAAIGTRCAASKIHYKYNDSCIPLRYTETLHTSQESKISRTTANVFLSPKNPQHTSAMFFLSSYVLYYHFTKPLRAETS